MASLYKKLLPRDLRDRFRELRKRCVSKSRDLRWRILPRSYALRATQQRLNVEQHGWAFIVGCNNSGTTLLLNVLGMHPEIKSLPKEGQRLTDELPFPPDFGIGRTFTKRAELFRWFSDDQTADVERIRYDWSFHVPRKPGWVLEKSPTNSLRALWLQTNFQPSKYLVLLRHPYAVCEGIRRRRGYSLDEAATHWLKVHEAVDADLPKLEHSLIVKYEEFCGDPLTGLRKLESFLNIAGWFDESFVEQKFPAHNMESQDQAIRNFNQKSLAQLDTTERQTIDRICAPMMDRFGYQPIHESMESPA